MSKDHLQHFENGINYYSKMYENFMLIEDFNAEISDTNISSSYAIHKFKSLIKEPACYKNSDNPTCIYLILTNFPKHFQVPSILETGL